MFQDDTDERIWRGHERHRGRDFERGPHGPRGPRGGRGHPHGPGGHGPGGFFPFALGAMFGRGPAVRRGDVRSGVLALLAEGPMHGYQIMQELTERSGGAWRPSAGSVYPTLQQLEDEGLVRAEERDGRRVYTLTEQGAAAAARAQEAGAPWEMDRTQDGRELATLVMQLGRAAMQVRQVGSANAVDEAGKILSRARRDMYRLLAEDEFEDDGGVASSDASPETEQPGTGEA